MLPRTLLVAAVNFQPGSAPVLALHDSPGGWHALAHRRAHRDRPALALVAFSRTGACASRCPTTDPLSRRDPRNRRRARRCLRPERRHPSLPTCATPGADHPRLRRPASLLALVANAPAESSTGRRSSVAEGLGRPVHLGREPRLPHRTERHDEVWPRAAWHAVLRGSWFIEASRPDVNPALRRRRRHDTRRRG